MTNAFAVQHYEHPADPVLRTLRRPLKLPPSSAENGELNAAIREAKSLSEFEAKVQSQGEKWIFVFRQHE